MAVLPVAMVGMGANVHVEAWNTDTHIRMGLRQRSNGYCAKRDTSGQKRSHANFLLLPYLHNVSETGEFPMPKKCLICLSPNEPLRRSERIFHLPSLPPAPKAMGIIATLFRRNLTGLSLTSTTTLPFMRAA